MKWSTKIATFAGISVYVHTPFLMLIAWVAFAHWQTGHSVSAAVQGVGFVLALFGCVVLREYGHALTAKRFGIKTRDLRCCPSAGSRGSSGCLTTRGRSCGWRSRDLP